MKKGRSYRVALMGMLFALSMALSFFESLLSGWIAVPGIKPGLSNIVVMCCVFCMGAKPALMLAVLKSFFVLLTRGVVGAAMSLAGGLCSVAVMLVANKLRCSAVFVSVIGGVSHNIGQVLMACVVLQSMAALYYSPILVAAGVGMGFLTGLLLRLLMPYFQHIFREPSSGGNTRDSS